MSEKPEETLIAFTHELNNLLVGIDGYGRLLSKEEKLSPDGKDFLRKMMHLVDSATDASLAFQKACGLRQHELENSTGKRGKFEAETPKMSFNIMVIDDDTSVREVVREALENEGFNVTCAADGQEALDIFEPGFFDAVLLDLRMPLMSGNLVFARLKALDSDLPIIVMSALISDERMRTFSEMGFTKFIQKPFQHSALISLVREVSGKRSRIRVAQNA